MKLFAFNSVNTEPCLGDTTIMPSYGKVRATQAAIIHYLMYKLGSRSVALALACLKSAQMASKATCGVFHEVLSAVHPTDKVLMEPAL